MDVEVLIVGGGLSGLCAAWRLKALGIDYRVVEARARVGGRIYSPDYGTDFDLGPSWIWPGQHQVAQLLEELHLEKFDQPVSGTTLYQLQSGQVQPHQGLSPMSGAYRIKRGSSALVNALADALVGDNTIYLEHICTKLSATEHGVKVQISHGESTLEWHAKTVAVAIPPRLAAKLSYFPALPSNLHHALSQLPTWMAAHAKIIALFDNAFWKEQGLSGTAMSQVGPLVEIHDASPSEGGPYALFGFVGYPADARQQIGQAELVKMAKQQLVSIFGPAAKKPIDVIIQDWSVEPFTADQEDLNVAAGHPAYGLSIKTEGEWDSRLHFISTETNRDNGGLIEGAIDRATQFAHNYSNDHKK